MVNDSYYISKLSRKKNPGYLERVKSNWRYRNMIIGFDDNKIAKQILTWLNNIKNIDDVSPGKQTWKLPYL